MAVTNRAITENSPGCGLSSILCLSAGTEPAVAQLRSAALFGHSRRQLFANASIAAS
jgi:hypothetical protein